MTNRPWWCRNCFTRPIRIFCDPPPVWRRTVSGVILLCFLFCGRHRCISGIHWVWDGAVHCCNSLFHRFICSRKLFIPVKVHMLVAGETFHAHDTFMQKLKMQIELCSAESSSVILVFCPVVSRIGTDMDAAMARVTENKPVIVVFMHHCHDPSHMTNISMQPTDSKIVQVVHCVFLENQGLLGCKENDQAVDAVRSELKKYK